MNRRQEIYDRIRETSRDEVALEEMIRLGFWPDDRGIPSSPAAEITRRGELERELRKLTKENRQLKNVEHLRREQRKQRLAESRRKRKETKERRLRERAERAAAWKRKKQSDIVYLGAQHSAGLSGREVDVAKLQRRGLEHLGDVGQLAKAMNCSVGLVRFLAFARRTSRTTHYSRFAIKKKTGGVREISAPMPRLKRAQRWILDNVLTPIEMSDCAHGFRPSRSIVTNAQSHVGQQVVVNMDLENFFPTVSYRRIKGLFRNIGFSESVATVLSLICSESDISQVQIDGLTYYVARSERFLPQGAPTSPAITNLICRGLDARLQRTAETLGFKYTRYADDLTFSSDSREAPVGRLIRRVEHIVSEEDFKVHPKKTRVFRTGRRMEVTGLTVNQKVNVSRKELRRFRAALHQIERDGPEGKTWGKSPDVISSIEGYANFVAMVDEEKGKKLQDQVRRIIEKHGPGDVEYIRREPWEEPTTTQLPEQEAPSVPQNEEQTSQDKKWWKFW